MKYASCFFALILTGWPTNFSFAASCCGGGANFPVLITGDFKSQVNSSLSYSSVIGDVDKGGTSTFRHADNNETTQTVKVDGSYLLSDYWQTGISIPIVKREKRVYGSHSESSGLGDVSAQLSFEFLPELRYSTWKPRGFTFLNLTLPTAPSIYDFNDPLGADARGRGFYTIDLGVSFLKTRGAWDFTGSFSIFQPLNKRFSSRTGESGMIYSTPGVSVLLGAGYTPRVTSPWRFGLSLSPRYEGRKVIETSTSSASEAQMVWDTGSSVSYLYEKELAFSAQYLDQTLLGPAQNTTLSRTISVNVQKRFSL